MKTKEIVGRVMEILRLDKTLSKAGFAADAAETGSQISVERARIDNLTAMRGSSNTTTFSISGDYFQGSFRTNGTGARIYLTIANIRLAGHGEYISDEYLIPVNFAPLGNVVLRCSHQNLDVTFVLGEVSADGKHYSATLKFVNKASEEMYVPYTFTADAYYPTAGVLIDELADIRVDYEGNTHATAGEAVRKQIQAVHSARLDEIVLLSSAWTGEDSLHSQVVTIEGITERSKVDLLPSVEQLAIFHNKDVAFVTENEDGVVTVYAIGDKPLLDYTMQVQITEVVV